MTAVFILGGIRPTTTRVLHARHFAEKIIHRDFEYRTNSLRKPAMENETIALWFRVSLVQHEDSIHVASTIIRYFAYSK